MRRKLLVLAVGATCLIATLQPGAGGQEAAPTQLVHSTYFGGRQEEMASELELDAAGNRYLTGSSLSNDYPLTDVAPPRRRRDFSIAPLTKLAPDGSLIFSTFVPGWNFAQGLEVDPAGNAYVVGDATEDLGTTPGAFDEIPNGEDDAFVARFDPDGNLVWATYLGGELPDAGTDVELDSAGNVVVVGYTFSRDFPVTEGAYDTTRPGSYDVFVSKLSPDGSQLLASTYLGGREGERGIGLTEEPSMELDATDHVYVTGATFSNDFPTTTGAPDPGGRTDAFASKLSPDLSTLVFSRLIGGSRGEAGTDLAVDDQGRMHLVGNTVSPDFPVTPEAFDSTLGRRERSDADGFVARLSPDGTTLEYATYLGGADGDDLSTIELAEGGAVWVSGSGSIDYPTTQDAFDPFPPFSDRVSRWARIDPAGDVVLTLIDAAGSALEYSTYVGGTSYELARDLELSGEEVLVAGYSESQNFPTTPDGYRPTTTDPAAHNMFLAAIAPASGEPCTNHGHDTADTVTGTAANDFLCGYEGDDGIDGLEGSDIVLGGSGADMVIGGPGYDVLLGGEQSDSMFGGRGPDSLFGEAGDDRLSAGAGRDTLYVGGHEDQLLQGGSGDDMLVGGPFSDRLVGRSGDDQMFGRDGSDRLRAGAGNDDMHGGKGRDICRGGAGNDTKTSCRD